MVINHRPVLHNNDSVQIQKDTAMNADQAIFMGTELFSFGFYIYYFPFILKKCTEMNPSRLFSHDVIVEM